MHIDKIDSLSDAERQRCEVWTRVMGYHRPVSEFNPGKQSEHAQRQHFREPATSERIATKVSAQWKPCA